MRYTLTSSTGRALALAVIGLPLAAQAAVTQLDFEDGLTYVTGGLAPAQIRWSGADGESRVPLSGAAWEASTFYDNGFLLGPSGTASDSYVWMYDTVAGFPDWLEVTSDSAANSTQGITFDFINSYRTFGENAQNPGYEDVGLVSADGTLVLVADAWTLSAAQGIQWNSVSASYDVTQTTWKVGSRTGEIATQAQVDSIIGSTGWIVRFGYENISGGYGANGPEFMAVDNLNIGADLVPEPSSALLALGGSLLFAGRRRRR